MRISVLGCGRWGSFIAWYLDTLSHDVTLYGRPSSPHIAQFARTRTNGLVTLAPHTRLTTDLNCAVDSAEVLIISISAQHLRALMGQLASLPLSGKSIVLCMKGLEERTGARLTQIARAYLPKDVALAIWVGPGHVQDFTQGIPNCMVIDSDDDTAKARLVEAFSGSLIRFYYGSDLVGNEIGAASKNVIGIAAGMLDGLGKSALKGALMSRGTREIARLISTMGGDERTAYGLSHLGDYEATVFSRYSHNRMYGERFVQGAPYRELAEGVSTVKAMMVLGEKFAIELPICRAVYQVIHQGQPPEDVLSDLFVRSIKHEFWS
nr:NAD(P)H-dependent glycerol-3-phosphate dehydrogenase [Maliibacterium massiliense]